MARAACGSAFAFVSASAQCYTLPATLPDYNNLFTTPESTLGCPCALHSATSSTGVPGIPRYEKIPARSTDSSCQLARHLVPSCKRIKAAANNTPDIRYSLPEYCPVRCLMALTV